MVDTGEIPVRWGTIVKILGEQTAALLHAAQTTARHVDLEHRRVKTKSGALRHYTPSKQLFTDTPKHAVMLYHMMEDVFAIKHVWNNHVFVEAHEMEIYNVYELLLEYKTTEATEYHENSDAPVALPHIPALYGRQWFNLEMFICDGLSNEYNTVFKPYTTDHVQLTPTLLLVWMGVQGSLTPTLNTLIEHYVNFDTPHIQDAGEVSLYAWKFAWRIHMLSSLRYAVRYFRALHGDDTIPWEWQQPLLVEQFLEQLAQSERLNTLVSSFHELELREGVTL